jgi:hypothetical protein
MSSHEHPNQPQSSQEVHIHNSPEKQKSPIGGAFTAFALIGVLAYGAYNYDAREGSFLDEANDAFVELIDDVLGRLNDPPAVNNPDCKAISPPAIEGLIIDPADMPRLCGKIITTSAGLPVHPDETVHLEMFTDNHFTEEFWEDLSNQNTVLVREHLQQLLLYNEPEHLLEILDQAGLCSEAVESIVVGIADTRAEDDPLNAGSDNSVEVKLYTEIDRQQILYQGGCS